jgi:uncharacterized protein with PQ loop repeat
MNSETGFRSSFHGFLDYSLCFPPQDIVWRVMGLLIFLGTWISVIPQYHLIISRRSAFGLDSITLFGMVVGQFALVANIIGLQAADFTGLLQYPFARAIWRMLTFVSAASNWLSFMPCAFLSLIFFDMAARECRDAERIKRERSINRIFIIAGPVVCLVSLVVVFAIGAGYGFGSTEAVAIGKALGIIAAVLWTVQYAPQFITTCRLRGSGNLSLILLTIQAPGSMANAIFMFVGQGTDWTTAVSSFLLSIEQFLLLIICIMFDIRNGTCKCPCAKKTVEYQQLPNTPSLVSGTTRFLSTAEWPES